MRWLKHSRIVAIYYSLKEIKVKILELRWWTVSLGLRLYCWHRILKS